jgi:hypothetical protein
MAVRSCRRAASSFVTVILALSDMGKPKEPELHPDAMGALRARRARCGKEPAAAQEEAFQETEGESQTK